MTTSSDGFGPNDVRVFVGPEAQLSPDATKALQDLASALDAEGAEVAGFMFDDQLAQHMMGGGGMMPTGPVIDVTLCKIDISVMLPFPL